MTDRLDGVSETARRRQITRECLFDLIKLAAEPIGRRSALDGGALGLDGLLCASDPRLYLSQSIGKTVPRQCAGCNGRLQLCAGLFVSVEISFQQVDLELCLGINQGRVGSRMAAAQRLGASAQRREFGFDFFHRGFPFEQKCHAASIGLSK